MKMVFGIADEKNAYFYEVEANNNIYEIISELDSKFYVQKKDVVLCDFYDNKVHNYGKYQDDIINGYANVIDVRTMHIDNRTTGLSRINNNPHFGVIELTISYRSQISRVIKNTFSKDYCSEQYKALDFTDMIKIVNSIDGIPNTFTYDSVVDKRFKYMNTSFSYTKNARDVNEKLFLNEKEKDISLDEYYEIISKVVDNTKFKLVATYALEKTYNEEIENMKRYAIRNSKLIEMPIFNPILKKIEVPISTNDKLDKNMSNKKNHKCKVYLQNNSIYDNI